MSVHSPNASKQNGVSYSIGFLCLTLIVLGVLALVYASVSAFPVTVRVLAWLILAAGVGHLPFAFLAKQRRSVHGWIRTRWFRTKVLLFERFFTPRLIAFVTGGIAVYGSAETFWGKTSFFTTHPNAHQVAKIVAWVTLIVVAVLSFLRERWKEQSISATETLFQDFMEFVARIVQQKIIRYATKAKNLPQGKKFDHVIQPKDQLTIIFTESAKFLMKTYKLSEEQVDFTIMERHNDGKWAYFVQHLPWKHTSPADLFSGPSCASEVIRTGQSMFYPSKKLAATDENYHLGFRDAADEDGSIYCSPLTVECPGSKWEFVVSIVTYQHRFCDPHDELNQQKTKGLLREIVRRIELELHLRAMKST